VITIINISYLVFWSSQTVMKVCHKSIHWGTIKIQSSKSNIFGKNQNAVSLHELTIIFKDIFIHFFLMLGTYDTVKHFTKHIISKWL
jgi:hypothetical protein